MSEDERETGKGNPDFSAMERKVNRVNFKVYRSSDPLPPNIGRFIYDEEEVRRLGNGDFMEGMRRLAIEVVVARKTLGEFMSDQERPLQDELDILPPPFQSPPKPGQN